MTTFRIGICGAGKIVPNHLEAIERTEHLQTVAISSRTMKSAKAMARKFRIGKVYDDHLQLVESPEVDVVLIATPNFQHFPLAMTAIAQGKHAIVEKPLAMTLAEGKKMVAAAKKAGLHLFYAEQLPLAPKFARLAALTQAGAFGKVYMVRQIERHSGPYSPWFFSQKTAGGGALVDLGCHSISTILNVMAGNKVEKVSATIRTFRHTQGDVDDFVLLHLYFADGAVGVVEANWCHLGGMDAVTEVYGSNGQGYADIKKNTGLDTFTEKAFLDGDDKQVGWQKLHVDHVDENGYLAQMQAIADTLINGAPPVQNGTDGVLVLRIMAAAYRSAKQNGKAIPLPR